MTEVSSVEKHVPGCLHAPRRSFSTLVSPCFLIYKIGKDSVGLSLRIHRCYVTIEINSHLPNAIRYSFYIMQVQFGVSCSLIGSKIFLKIFLSLISNFPIRPILFNARHSAP